jgi:phosphoglycerate dehydrogenase-like enzyme
LLSDHSARELGVKISAICGLEGWSHVTAEDVHSGVATPDVAFISREVTGHSTKHRIMPATQFFYDALLKAQELKWLQIHSAGADRQVFLDLLAKGVMVTTASGASAGMVAQTALTGLLSLARRFPQLAEAQRAHEWMPFIKTSMPPELEGQTATIVGWGPIGQKLGAWLSAIGLNIVAVRRTAQEREGGVEFVAFEKFEEILPTTDWLILACPLTAQTTNLLSAHALAKMKPTAHVINVSRGAVIDEPAMIAALNSGKLAGAFLDVFAQEPLPKESPLWDMQNVICSPHTAGFSDGIVARVAQVFIDNLQRWHDRKTLINIASLG